MSKFSEDILFEILSWLPVSSLLRFRIVCKSWFSLITQNPSFAKSQLVRANSTQNDNPMVLFTSHYHGTLCSIKYVDIASLPLPLPNVHENLMKHPTNFNHAEFTASCNGLICIVKHRTIICLWNPSTEEIKELPDIPHPSQRYRLLAFGFGCNRTLDDYKVVKIMQFVGTDASYNSYVLDDKEGDFHFNVYTLRTNSWKRIQVMRCKFRDFTRWEAASGLHINGALHWIGSMPSTESNNGIISFDIEDEEYGEVPKPECLLDSMDSARLQVLGGCLCVFNFVSDDRLDVWMMKDYGVKESWTKLFTTTQFMLMKHQYTLKPLWLLKHGEVLMAVNHIARKFALYDPKCDTFEYIELQPLNNRSCDIVIYIESLVSLESGTYAWQYITSSEKKKRTQNKRIVSTDSLTIGS